MASPRTTLQCQITGMSRDLHCSVEILGYHHGLKARYHPTTFVPKRKKEKIRRLLIVSVEWLSKRRFFFISYVSDESIYPINCQTTGAFLSIDTRPLLVHLPYPHDIRGTLSSLMMSLVHNLPVSDKVTGAFTWF